MSDNIYILQLPYRNTLIGRLEDDGTGMLTLRDPAVIREWGTTGKGLGQLALEGKQESTILDKAHTIKVPRGSLIYMIHVKPEVAPSLGY